MNEKEKREIALVAAIIEGTGSIITKSEEFDPMTASLDTLNEIKNALKQASMVVDQMVLHQVFELLNNE